MFKTTYRIFYITPKTHIEFSTTKKPFKNHYETLNLPRSCTTKDVKEAFIKLSKQYHPDVSRDKESQAKFVKILQAYNALSKPLTRKNYDLGLARPGRMYSGSREWSHSPRSRSAEYYRAYYEENVKNPYEDPVFWTNRDKSKDWQYRNNSYYGVEGVERLSNKIVVMLCLIIAAFGVALQVVAIRQSVTFSRDELNRRSAEASRVLASVRKQALENEHELQVERLKEKLEESDRKYHLLMRK